jgi:hypothetical protein
MRELTLVETGYLAVGLLLCLVLPLLMSLSGPLPTAARKSCLKIVWTGQILLALAGLMILASASLAPYAAAAGCLSCLGCALLLWRKLRNLRPALSRLRV